MITSRKIKEDHFGGLVSFVGRRSSREDQSARFKRQDFPSNSTVTHGDILRDRQKSITPRDHLPLTSNRSSRARSLDSQRLVNEIRKRRETDLSSGKTVAHPSSQTIVGLADSPASKAHTKRTVVWFDQISKNGSSIHSRHSRTTSLPSSWDEILHSPAADEPQEARLRLGSVSELWLDFQSQQLSSFLLRLLNIRNKSHPLQWLDQYDDEHSLVAVDKTGLSSPCTSIESIHAFVESRRAPKDSPGTSDIYFTSR
ncbi:hypothetical protein KEM48_006267 [Puccinia striiformis f. sp. tritici PST-130]|nr:hypothetical protein KEM48_006267 [Puccinia striiformis f. sp. tritici PST-130]